MRVALYARVSTRDKDQNPETQLMPLRAALGDGDDLVGEFVDHASADDERGRREWRRLLDLAIWRKVDVIWIWRIDRAFRSVLHGAQTLSTLRTASCGLKSHQDPWIDTTTAFGEAMFHITLTWAQLENARIVERVKAGMDRPKREAKRVGRDGDVVDHPHIYSKSLGSSPAPMT